MQIDYQNCCCIYGAHCVAGHVYYIYTTEDIKENATVTVKIDFVGHQWGNLPMILTFENHWQIISLLTNKIVIYGNKCIIQIF